MRGGAVELFVQRALLMQHAVENIRRDPPRRETRHLGWQCESLRGHGAGTSRKNGIALSVSAYAAGRKSLLPLEYAKYKNRPTVCTVPHHLYIWRLELSELFPRLETER